MSFTICIVMASSKNMVYRQEALVAMHLSYDCTFTYIVYVVVITWA